MKQVGVADWTEIVFFSDNVSKQVVALQILSECLGKGTQSLNRIYEEFPVCLYVPSN